MSKLSWWKRTAMAAGVMIAAVAAVSVQPRQGRSAEPQAPAPGPAAEKPKYRYFGSKSCDQCHSVSKERPTNTPEAIGYIYLDEYTRWSTEDKHRLAFARLSSERGRRMAGLLKADVTKRETGCLGCHSAGTAETSSRRQGNLFDPNEGVSCENCHGPYEGWALDHTQPDFRGWDAKKRAEKGMIDVRVPEIQAAQCLSCHIGDAAEGKVVTHEMYAAGHPPLPSIEVATFADFIPRHWMLVDEKAADKVKEAEGYRKGELERTKLAIVGASVALNTSMNLIAQEYTTPAKDVPGQAWPDYARYDCWSCHHDLKRESWRQARGYEMPPGRVPVGEWPLPLVRLGIARIGMEDADGAKALNADLERLQNELHEQASNRPFGREQALIKAASALASWSVVVTKKLVGLSYDRIIAFDLLRALVEEARKTKPDYDAARHVAWMIKLLVEDLKDDGFAREEKEEKQKDGEKAKKMASIRAIMAKDRPAIESILSRLDDKLKLELPAGRKYEIEDFLGPALEKIGDYDPDQFQADLDRLAEILNAK